MHGRIISAAVTAMLAFAGPAAAQTIEQGPSRITTDATPTFSFNGEPGSTFECLIEPAGTWKSCSSPYSVQLPDGDYVFSVRAKDGAGNVEPNPPRWAFTVDTSTVDTTIEGGPGDVTNDATPSFTFATETTGATFECQIDGPNSSVPAWASCSSPFEVPKLRSGAYTLNVRAKSPQGKFDTTPAQRAFTIDADAPDTTIVTGPGEGSRTSPIQKFEFSASEPGSTYECRIDNVSKEGVDTKTWEACAPLGQFTTPKLSGGQHTVEVRATDRAGNTDETPAKRSYTVEDCQPVVRFGVIEAIAPCLQNVGTEDQPVYESKDTVKVNGIPLPSIGGGKIVLTAPTPEKKGGAIAIQNAKLELAGIKLYEGGMAWDLPEGKLGEEKEFKKIDLSKAGQKLFGMKVEGHVALRLRAPAQAGGTYKSVLALHIALPEAFKSGPDSGSGSVTGDVAINIDNEGVHLDGLKIKVENAYIGKLGVKLVCLSFASAGSSAVEPCQAPAIGPGKPKPYMECRSDNTADRWDGALAIVLPTASKTQLGMWGGLRNGKLSHAGAYVDGLGTMVPLAPGVFLESVRLGVCLEPPPFQVKGGAAVSFGPSVDGKSAVRIDGDLHYSDAWNGTPWFIKANGSLSLFGKQVATSDFTYWGSGMIDFNFRGELDFGLAQINGGVAGWIETKSPSRFNVEGWVSVCVYKIGCLDGRAVASSIGAAGCIKVTLLEVPVLVKDKNWKIWAPWRVHWEWQKVSVKGGAGYTWKNHDLDLMLSSCSIGKWILARPSQAGALPTISVPADMPAFTARVHGKNGPPKVDLVGPDGRRISVPEDGGELVEGSHMIAPDPNKNTTSILVTGPAAGEWRIEPHAGEEVTDVDKAFATPVPTLVGGVGGKGHKRVLGYSYAPAPGQKITFVEKGPRTKRVIGVAKPGRCREAAGGVETERKTACGQLRFTPGAGPAGTRDIVAQIEQDGRPGEEIKVASYVAPKERMPAKPGLLRARRTGSTVLVRWASVPNAVSYNAVVTTSDGRKLSFAPDNARKPIRVAGIGRDVTVRVAMRTVRLDGQVSKAARVRIKATRKANVAPHKSKPLKSPAKKKGGRR